MSGFTVTESNLCRYNSIKEKYAHLYTHVTAVPARNLLARPGMLSIWILEGLSHSAHFFATDQFLDTYTRQSLYFFTLPFWHDADYYSDSLFFILEVAPHVNPAQIVVLGNSFDEVIFAREAGMSKSFLCNHNCWLDPNLFVIGHEKKIYDLVINTRPESWKRPYLAASVDRLAIIKGNHYRKHDYYDLETLNPAYINAERISADDVVSILNSSWCGGIFSQREGACYSSSEYLLCGLPVVSTTSIGGREIWYDQFNSVIIHDESPAAVREAVERIKLLTDQGFYVAHDIRMRHIFLQNQFINVWKRTIANWLEESGVILNVDDWFSEIYQHKMTKYASWSTH